MKGKRWRSHSSILTEQPVEEFYQQQIVSKADSASDNNAHVFDRKLSLIIDQDEPVAAVESSQRCDQTVGCTRKETPIIPVEQASPGSGIRSVIKSFQQLANQVNNLYSLTVYV